MLIQIGPFERGTSLETYRRLLESCDCYTWLSELAPTIFGAQRQYILGKHYSTEFSCFFEESQLGEQRSIETLCVNPGPAQLTDLANRLLFAAQQVPQYCGDRNQAQVLQYDAKSVQPELKLLEPTRDERVA